MPVTVKSNHQWRALVYRCDVPAKVLESQFDYLGDDAGDSFFRYRGHWYHLSDFMRLESNEDLKGWHGYAGDSYFSGVVIKLSRDGDSVQVGTYFS